MYMVKLPSGKHVYGFKSWEDAMRYARKVSGTPLLDDGLR